MKKKCLLPSRGGGYRSGYECLQKARNSVLEKNGESWVVPSLGKRLGTVVKIFMSATKSKAIDCNPRGTTHYASFYIFPYLDLARFFAFRLFSYYRCSISVEIESSTLY